MKAAIIGITAALLLAACGGKNEADGTAITMKSDETGNTATLRYGDGEDGIAPPANLPAFAPVFPGAAIQSAISGNEGEAKGMIMMLAKAKTGEVLEFYRQKGKDAGLQVKGEMAMGPSRILAMGPKDGGDGALQITATPSGEEPGSTMITVNYDGGAAAAK